MANGRSAAGRGPAARAGERDLVRLVYVSMAAPGLTAADLEDIATRAAARNRAAGLTGLLLYQAGGFYAVLEGPRRKLLACMERVATDRRHTRMEVLHESAIDERRFDTWTFSDLAGVATRAVPLPEADDFIRTFCRRIK